MLEFFLVCLVWGLCWSIDSERVPMKIITKLTNFNHNEDKNYLRIRISAFLSEFGSRFYA